MRGKRYYTSNATIRYAIVLLFIIGVNVLFLEMGPHHVSTIAALICYHAWLFGRIAAYMAEGIFTSGSTKWVYTFVFFLLFVPFVFFTIALEVAVTGACALALAAVLCFWVYTPGKMNGDNDRYSQDDIDTRWFDTVDTLAYTLWVSFPLDIGCYKTDRLEGTIEALGLASAGKYEGQEVALVTAMGKRYVCPIRSLKPAELHGGEEGVVIASNDSKEVSFISWKDGKKATGVFYVLSLGGADPQA
jgi:hypothetical protein